MNPNMYRWCSVPQCTNTSIKTPNKLFEFVPIKKTIRNTWLKLARRDSTGVLPNAHLYFCEDHFDLPNDMENYMQYHIMGTVSQIRMKPGCNPSKFSCQPDRRKRTSDTMERQYILKKQRKIAIEECEKEIEEKATVGAKQLEFSEASFESSVLGPVIAQDSNNTANKCIQVNMTNKFRSKYVQTEINAKNQMTSPSKPFSQSVATSPIKFQNCAVKPSLFKEIESDDDSIFVAPSETDGESSPSDQTGSSLDSEVIEEDKMQEAFCILQSTLQKIKRNPRFYIGVPAEGYYLIEKLKESARITPNNILMCLKKIRLNNPFIELADDFAITPSYASKIFQKNVPIIASLMQPFMVTLKKDLIKKNLPIAFRHKYHHVSCIIDCLEIEIQKPSKAVQQSLTWSEYKKTNTIKYLISCTPNGLINYISPGYGGRITDTCLVESCDFIKHLEPGMCVMADRGFKHVEQYLRKEGVFLLRPPSVTTGAKLSKSEVRETKQVASLRIHVERVIRRLREFDMLKPRASLNLNLVKVLDDVITIACGLINLQNSLIK